VGSADRDKLQVRFRSLGAGKASRYLTYGTLGLSVQIRREKVNENIKYFAGCDLRHSNPDRGDNSIYLHPLSTTLFRSCSGWGHLND